MTQVGVGLTLAALCALGPAGAKDQRADQQADSGAGRQMESRGEKPATAEGCLTCVRVSDLEACHRLALELAESRDYDPAIAIEERVHARQPANPEVGAALARMHHLGRKNVPRAIELYHAALGASSGFPPALFGLGTIMLEKGELDIARRYFARGANERPDLPLFKLRMAEVLVKMGRDTEAQPVLQEVVARWPTSDEAMAARKLISRITLARP